jgi:hypothetical protein
MFLKMLCLILLGFPLQLSAQVLVQAVTVPAIRGESEQSSGVSGLSLAGNGVSGITLEGVGVYAYSSNGFGLEAHSESNYGIKGNSSGSHGAYFRGASGSASIVLGGSNYIAGSDDGVIMSDPTKSSSDIILVSNDALVIKLDNDNNEAGQFEIWKGNNEEIFAVDESGNVKLDGTTIHSSDRNRKTNFQPVKTADILAKLCAIPIEKWNYKEDTMTHIGPTAQDFYAAFNLGQDEKTICAVDADGVLMAAVQALAQENQTLKKHLLDLDRKINFIIQQAKYAPD